MRIRSALAVGAVVSFLLPAPLGAAQLGHVVRAQKVSETSGGFGGSLDEQDQFGRSIVNLGDLDGDGVSDLLVGSHTDDDGPDKGLDRGSVWILFMAPNGFVRSQVKISEGHGGFSGWLDPGDQFGRAAARVGDLDGDGLPEVAVSANYDDDGGTNKGAIYILFLRPDGNVRHVQKISQTQGGLGVVLDIHDEFGRSITPLGDLDGDGVPDLCVGAPLDDDGGTQIGAAYVLFLDREGRVKNRHKISRLTDGIRLKPGDWFGFCGAHLGDLDGDGLLEIALGAVLDDDGGFNQGALWILSLDAAGVVRKQVEINELTAGLPLDDIDQFGTSVACLGDLDGDGVSDIAVGAVKDDDGGPPGNVDADVGAVYVLYLRPDGSVKGHSKISDLVGDLPYPLDVGDWFGSGLARLGGSPGDGLFNLAIGARYDNDGGGNNGAIYLVQLNDGHAPWAEFEADRTEGVAPLTVAFRDRSGGDVTGWIWNFGDGPVSAQPSPVHTYTQPGSYSVRLAVRGPKGVDTLLRPAFITVGSGVLADFEPSTSGGLAPLEVAFRDLSQGTISTWSWDFGDGSGSTEPAPRHVYEQPGSFSVALTVQGPEGSHRRVAARPIVVVSDPPQADFSAWPAEGLAPLAVSFEDRSRGLVTAWHWDLGDGTVSDEPAPRHVYTGAGSFRVRLTVSNPGGSDTRSVDGSVSVRVELPQPAFSAAPTSGMAPLSVAFEDASQGVTDWLWSFGDGGTSTDAAPLHVYTKPGLFDVTLSVVGPGGKASEVQKGLVSVSVPAPVAAFDCGPVLGFAPLPVSFSDLSEGQVTARIWSFGDGTTSTARFPVKTYSRTGTYWPVLSVRGPGGTHSVQGAPLTVQALPVLADGGFERQTGLVPGVPWSLTKGAQAEILSSDLEREQGFPSDGIRWCALSSQGSAGAQPPGNPGGSGAPPAGAMQLKRTLAYQALAPYLSFEAAFLLGPPPGASETPDFMSVDLSDGRTSWNVFLIDGGGELPGVSGRSGLPMSALAGVRVDLSALFPEAAERSPITVTVSLGHPGGAADGYLPSQGYVDGFRLVPRALSSLRNGLGKNPLLYQASPAVLGGEWTVRVDSSARPGPQLVQITGTSRPSSGGLRSAGEVLVGGPVTFSWSWASSGALDERTLSIPLAPSLVGRLLCTQATLLGTRTELCNAVDLVLGF